MKEKKATPPKTMTIEDALLEDIREHPDDDTPRLALADLLQEQGGASEQARAEFIRNQVEMARLPEGDPRLAALRQREAKLLRRYKKKWLAELGLDGIDAWFERGFVEGPA